MILAVPFTLFPRVIKTMADLKAATTATYLFDIMIAIFMVVALVIVANAIPYEPGKQDNSGSKRRLSFFIIAFLTLAAGVGLDYFIYLKKITVPAYVTKYLTTMAIAAIVGALVFCAVGFILVKISRKGTKLESIFPKKG